ncbi:MAG TPA: oligosaccharide flippase family protein [Gemmatimonadales bacterium]|nr:oligosaccharide flippase family protein [Gemmatimonadales bacterium]
MVDAHNELKRGLWWLGGATLAMRLLDVGATLLVLQFLTKGDVGLATVSWSIAVVLEAFNGLGVGIVAVRQHDLTHRELSGLFWFSTLLGFVAIAIMALAAPALAQFYGDARLAPMIVVSSSKLLFVGASLIPLQLLSRDLKFRDSGAAQTLASLGEASVKVFLVVAGFGAWGLVIANVARGACLLLALWWFSPFRPAWTLSVQSTVRSIKFGAPLAVGSVLYAGYRNADFLLIGRVLGKEALGVYRVAFDLGMAPLEIVFNLVSRVQLPIYAKLRHDLIHLREAFYRSARSLVLIVGPVTALLSFASVDLLDMIGGGRWIAAAPLVPILCWASLLRGITQLFPQIYLVAGKPQYSLYDTMISGATLVLGFSLALWLAPPALGSYAVAWAWLLSYPVPLVADFIMVRWLAPITPAGMLRAVTPPALGVALMVAVLALGSMLRPVIGSPLLTLVSLIVLGLGTYTLYLGLALHLRFADLLPQRDRET